MGFDDTSVPENNSKVNSGFAGTIKNVQLNDLIQMCCLSASSMCIRVTIQNRVGTIYVIDGEIIHADCGKSTGEEAFFRIMGWQAGSFETLKIEQPPEPTIKQNCQFLIMEAARFADEKNIQSEASNEPAENKSPDKIVRVLIVDDSPLMCKILISMLDTDPGIEVVGTAKDGSEAVSMAKELKPDLITLDVNMPVMDGTTAIKHIMIKSPMPVVIMSNLGTGSSDTIFNFLSLGAVDFMSKPVKNNNILIQQQKIVERVHTASRATVKNFRIIKTHKVTAPKKAFHPFSMEKDCLVVVNSGAGGHCELINGIYSISQNQGTHNLAVISLQTLPPAFKAGFSEYLNSRCLFKVSPIGDIAPVLSGCCYIGTNGRNLKIQLDDNEPRIVAEELDTASEGSGDYFDGFLTTASDVFKHQLITVLLSGAETGHMEGLKKVKENGGHIIVAKPESSMVSDPLESVVSEGLADMQTGPQKLFEAISKLINNK